MAHGMCVESSVKTTISVDDLLIWRECGGLGVADFPSLISDLSELSTEASKPLGNPHTRSDIAWLPVSFE